MRFENKHHTRLQMLGFEKKKGTVHTCRVSGITFNKTSTHFTYPHVLLNGNVVVVLIMVMTIKISVQHREGQHSSECPLVCH